MKLTAMSVHIAVFWLILGKCLLHSSTFKNKNNLRNRFNLNFLLPNITVSVEGWTYHSDNKTKLNWKEAREWCQKHYTDIVMVHNENVTHFLTKYLPSRSSAPYYWIGLKNISNSWTWVANGQIANYQNWGDKEPNSVLPDENCVEYISNPKNNGKWNDESCIRQKYPVCQKGKEPELVFQFVNLFPVRALVQCLYVNNLNESMKDISIKEKLQSRKDVSYKSNFFQHNV